MGKIRLFCNQLYLGLDLMWEEDVASLPKLALRPYLAPPGLPARCRSSRQSSSLVHERGALDQVVYIDLFQINVNYYIKSV